MLDIQNVALQVGSTVVLTLFEDGGANGPGDFIGLDLQVALP